MKARNFLPLVITALSQQRRLLSSFCYGHRPWIDISRRSRVILHPTGKSIAD
jgi:hypothetical protein